MSVSYIVVAGHMVRFPSEWMDEAEERLGLDIEHAADALGLKIWKSMGTGSVRQSFVGPIPMPNALGARIRLVVEDDWSSDGLTDGVHIDDALPTSARERMRAFVAIVAPPEALGEEFAATYAPRLWVFSYTC